MRKNLSYLLLLAFAALFVTNGFAQCPSGTLFTNQTQTICGGQTIQYVLDPTDPALINLGGGTWTSSNTAVAVVNQTGVITGVAEGTSLITYTAPCGGTFTRTVTVSQPVKPFIFTNGSTDFCFGGGVSISTTSTANNYEWRRDGTLAGTGHDVFGTTTGNYSLRVRDANNCLSVYSDPIAIHELTSVSGIILGSEPVCQGEGASVIFRGNGASKPYTFSYNVNGGSTQTVTTVGTNDEVTIQVPTGVAGDYNYTLLGVSGASGNGCQQSYNSRVLIRVKLKKAEITPGGNVTICSGESITLTANESQFYDWSGTGQQVLTRSVTVSAAGSYTVTTVNASGCVATSAPTVVTLKSLPTASIGGTATVCQNAPAPSITFTGAGGTAPYTFTYKINGGADQTVSTTSGNSVSIAAPTSTAGVFMYSLMAVRESSATACSKSETFIATVTVNGPPPVPMVTVSDQSGLCGAPVTLTATSGNTWVQKASFTSLLQGGMAFSIGSLGYVGVGSGTSGPTNSLWAYDPSTNVWTQKADFGGLARTNAVGFSIGYKGYIGTGIGVTDFWEYDPFANTWVRKADFPAAGGYLSGGVGFSVGNKGYVGTGVLNFADTRAFYEYDPSTNAWLRKADFGGAPRSNAAGFSLAGKGYIGTGFSGALGFQNDFWEYNPATDTWTEKAAFGGLARRGAAGFAVGNKGYIATGSGDGFAGKDVWEYDPALNSWVRKVDLPGGGRRGAAAFSIGNKGYLGVGANSSANFNDFYEYTPAASLTWSPGGQTTPSIVVTNSGNYSVVASYGQGCNNSTTVTPVTITAVLATPTISAGGPTEFCTGNSVLLTSSRPSGNQWYLNGNLITGATASTYSATASGIYTVAGTNNGCSSAQSAGTTVTSTQPPQPATLCYQTATFDPATCLWVLTGTQPVKPAIECYQTATFNNTTCSWDVTGTPVTVTAPVITAIGSSFCVESTVTLSIPTSNSWTQKALFGGSARYSAVGFSIGDKGYIGTGYAQGTYTRDFWEYNPATNAWTQKANFGGSARMEATGFAAGGKGYLGTGSNSTSKMVDFWEYNPATNSWIKKADFGGGARSSAASFAIGTKGYIGTGSSSTANFNDLWEYDPTTDTWVQKASLPGTRVGAAGFSIGNKGYIGTGYTGPYNAETASTEFLEYDAAANRWASKAPYAGSAVGRATSFSIGSKGYIGTGFSGGRSREFWEYNPATDTWTNKAAFGGLGRSSAVGFSINGKGYIGTGSDINSGAKDFWEYDPLDYNYTTFKWSPGNETSSSIVVTTAGTYSVTVYNAIGCSAVSQPVTVTMPPKPALLCYQQATTFNTATCEWVVTGTQPVKPTTLCYQTATFNNSTCQWVVTGTQPTKPANQNCWDNYQFNNTSCSWVNVGSQPVRPTTACYQTATFNSATCTWVISGTQPPKPVTPCFQQAVFNPSTCQWQIQTTETGMYPGETFTPSCSGTDEFIVGETYPGEYAVVNVVAGTSYTFTCDVSSDGVEISDIDANTLLASGHGSVSWVATLTGPVRFYSYTSECRLIDAEGRTKYVTCTARPLITAVSVPVNNCLVTTSHSITANVTTTSGIIASVVINYNNGTVGTAAMSLTSGTTYTGTIPAGTSTAPVTWSITAVGSSGGSTTIAGSTYTDGVPPAIAMDDVSITGNITAGGTVQFLKDCELIATLQSNGGSPQVTGQVTAKVWIEPTQPTYNGIHYVRRHYEVTPTTNAANATGIVTLYYSQTDFDAFNAVSPNDRNLPTAPDDEDGKDNFAIYKFSGTSSDGSGLPGTYTGSGALIQAPAITLVWDDVNHYWKASFATKGFSGFFAFNNDLTLLPITDLLSFKVEKAGNNGIINWHMNAGHQVNSFVVEKSYDGNRYTALLTVAGKAGTNDYQAIDPSLQAGRQYYRLKLLEKDGSMSYSAVRTLLVNRQQAMVVAPNPTKGKFTIDLQVEVQSNAIAQIQLQDIAGKIIYTQKASINAGVLNQSVNMPASAASGVYVVRVIINGKTYHAKLMFEK